MALRKIAQLQETQKSDQQGAGINSNDRPGGQLKAEQLGVELSSVLANPTCPEILREAIIDALNEFQSHVDTLSADFLVGLFQAPRREGGVQ